MMNKINYANGQKIYEQNGNKRTFYFKTGKIKAEGIFEQEQMEGEWKFYRETGQLWQVGNFVHNKKNGSWTRFDKNDKPEYQETFRDDKIQKKSTKG